MSGRCVLCGYVVTCMLQWLTDCIKSIYLYGCVYGVCMVSKFVVIVEVWRCSGDSGLGVECLVVFRGLLFFVLDKGLWLG